MTKYYLKILTSGYFEPEDGKLENEVLPFESDEEF